MFNVIVLSRIYNANRNFLAVATDVECYVAMSLYLSIWNQLIQFYKNYFYKAEKVPQV